MMRIRLAIGLLFAAPALAQSEAPAKLEFEVVSIKPASDSTVMSTAYGVLRPGFVGFKGAEVMGREITLETLIKYAYILTPFTDIKGGPDWMRSAKYDVVAKAPRPISNAEFKAMLRALLADRFGLALHTEDKEMQVFVLELAKGGAKLRETSGPEGSLRPLGPTHWRGKSATVPQLAMQMSLWSLGAPVLDHTGLTGFYDFDLEWRRLELDAAPAATPQPERTPWDASTIAKSLEQQLGLKLTARKAPMPVTVVDRARKPAEN